MQCLTIAIENPAQAGQYRVFNQFEECYSVEELACLVQEVGVDLGIKVDIQHFENPRSEPERHYFNPDRNHLINLGYKPTRDVKGEIRLMLHDLERCRERILQKRDSLVPDIRWDGLSHRSEDR